MGTTPESPSAEQAPKDVPTTRLGKFIQTYHTFLSSFVIGVAGLIATSIWQYRQAETASRQAVAQQHVAELQADNNWKIEKAQILAKNLQVLAQGSGNIEERYGVLLSLSRGDILDPELAVSYALDLGKESPEYMRSVLANTAGKDFWRLARAFEPTCEQRYVTKDKTSPETLEDLLGLVALVEIPNVEPSREAWNKLLGQLQEFEHAKYAKFLSERRIAATRARTSPPPAMKKFNFCGAEARGQVAAETKVQSKMAFPARARRTNQAISAKESRTRTLALTVNTISLI